MKEMQIIYLNPDEIVPYENNPRHNDDAVEALSASIREYGFKVPIIIDKNNVIVAGHTRLKASKALGLKKVPCIRADDLDEEQVRAFRIADNRIGEIATWDQEKLEIELEEIEIDMSEFGLDIDFSDEKIDAVEDDGWYGDERLRTDKAYHLDVMNHNNLTDDFWQMPIIRNNHFIPDDFIGFNYAKTNKSKEVGVHFYIDDYQFERVWTYPDKYLEVLEQYQCIISPDFSIYSDMPMPMKIWNTYRNRWIGAYYQAQGLNVIPNLNWDTEDTYEFCFRGIPKGSIVARSTISMKSGNHVITGQPLKDIWINGMKEAIRQIEPEAILLYGGRIDFDFGDIPVIEINNKVLDKWQQEE